MKVLIEHWMVHNDAHAENYMSWAEKALSLGKGELSKIFVRLYFESKRVNRLLEKAKRATN